MSVIDKLFGPVAANDNSPKCERCGASFTPRHGKRFCSDACQRADYNDKRRGDKEARLATAPEHICEHCGSIFKRRRRKKQAARFCSRECGFEAKSNIRAEQTVTPSLKAIAKGMRVSFRVARCLCVECGGHFSSTSILSTYCSDACRNYAFWRRRGVDASDRKCKWCGETYKPIYGRAHAVYCSLDCAKAAARKSPAARRAKAKRKAIARGSGANDNVDPFEVFERDKWTCQLCGVKTPKKLRGTCKPNAPELDHIMPIAMGGAHTYVNTQCACRRCNSAKGAQFIGQLRLFG